LNKNLALTGMIGAGKSTIGRTLSKKLLMQFSDIDKIIENKLEMSIHKIFEEKGEPYFRKLEEKITIEEVKKKNIVISLGGGAFMNPRIRKNILLHCKSFWLDLSIELIEKRLTKSNKRPLLNKRDIKTTLEKIYKERKRTYVVANHRINCDQLSTNLITSKIIKLYADS